MSRVKRSHTVPRFYLSRFANDRGGLFVFDKSTGKTFKARVEDVAAEGGFYDLPQGGTTDHIQAVERWLSELEGSASTLISAVIADAEAGLSISSARKSDLASLLALQVLRTAESRRGLEQLQAAFVEAFAGENLGMELRRMVEEAKDPEHARLLHLSMMLSPELIEELADVLLRHIWILGVNGTGLPLWTSDHPVVRRAHLQDQNVSYAGLGSAGIEISFPLSPVYVLTLAERRVHHYAAQLEDGRLTLNDDNVTYYNSLQAGQAYRQVFSPLNDFGVAEELRSRHPSMFSLDRARVGVDRGRPKSASPHPGVSEPRNL